MQQRPPWKAASQPLPHLHHFSKCFTMGLVMYISYPTPASQGAQGRTGSGNRMLTEQPTAWSNAGFPDCDRNEQNVHGGRFLYRCRHSLHRPTWRSSRSQCVLIPEAAAVTAVPRLGFRPIKHHMCDPEAPKHASETFFLHRIWL